MAATEQFLITLPADMAELLHRKIASGEYANESEVIADSLTFLASDDEPEAEDHTQRLDRWLRDEVVPACLEFDADPSSGISPQELRLALEEARNNRDDG